MSASLTNIQPTDSGWVLDMTPEMVRIAGVEPRLGHSFLSARRNRGCGYPAASQR